MLHRTLYQFIKCLIHSVYRDTSVNNTKCSGSQTAALFLATLNDTIPRIYQCSSSPTLLEKYKPPPLSPLHTEVPITTV